MDHQYAAYLDINHPKYQATLKNAAGDREIHLIVVTDAEGILGIGDWGTNGVDIARKLMVYTQAAGIDQQVFAFSDCCWYKQNQKSIR